MEKVLDLYAEPYDPAYPQVCFDEGKKELRGEIQASLPPRPGQPKCQDYEYVRNGAANLFLLVCPLVGWRHLEVTQRRTRVDFAHQMKALVDVHFPEAKKIRIVMDNLNTHTPGSLYEAFAPAEAKRIVDRLEFHYTPKHASWLNMAEMEFSALTRQCLDRRIADVETLKHEIAMWQQERNTARVTINWCFRLADARVKLEHLYPSQSL